MGYVKCPWVGVEELYTVTYLEWAVWLEVLAT